ncbi:MAG: hypothetical protein WCP21_06660 [Armatimonadota bacterium]
MLLALSAYFLPYRRLGLCEAGGALAATYTIWTLLRLSEDAPGSLARRHSWWLGVLCGLSFGMNTRTLLLLPAVLAWRAWHLRRSPDPGAQGPRRLADPWALHALRVAGGFLAVLALYQALYYVIGPFAAHLGYQVDDYLAQLHRFATAQGQLGRVGLVAAYGAPAYFFLRNEGPVVVCFALGLAYLWRRRATGALLLPSLLVLPLLQTAVLIPYARYQSWLLPIFAMIGAAGLDGLCRASRRRSPRLATTVLVAALLLVAGYSGYRGLPVMQAHSRHAEALHWCHQRGAVSVFVTNLGAAYAQTDLYDLAHLRLLPTSPEEALAEVRRLAPQGPVMILTDTQQYMKSELLMAPKQYEQSTAALLRRESLPLWQQAGHLRGLFPFVCFEHNRFLPDTLRTLKRYTPVADELRIYDGVALLKAQARRPSPAVSLGLLSP